MLIKVLLDDSKEAMLNADCQVDFLLDTIKKLHNIPRSTLIDLCTTEGEVKELHRNGYANGDRFFKHGELCLVVCVQNSSTSEPYYTPALKEYANNSEFEGLLNQKEYAKTKLKQSYTARPRSSGARSGSKTRSIGSAKSSSRKKPQNS